jgi:outer membrane biosynthesis protein TonB
MRHPRPADAHPDGADPSASAEAARVAALVTPVQSDVWMLAAPTNEGKRAPAPDGVGVAAVTGAGPPDRQDSTSTSPGAPGGPSPGGGTSGASEGPASLLAALSQRLAWSAERCAPAAVVRSARRPVPGVPLHFCLDASGQPSEVGLLGTTGSEQLDRAARDCVVPGAAPLPPVPGCYTVEVRFPTRG